MFNDRTRPDATDGAAELRVGSSSDPVKELRLEDFSNSSVDDFPVRMDGDVASEWL